MYFTYADAIEHVSAYLGKDVSRYGASAVRRAIQSALLELPSHHDWTYYQTAGRVVTAAPYNSGSVAYTESTRAVTLTGGTWPAWAAYGLLRIGQVYYEIETRDSGTQLTLKEATTPGENLAAGTTYELVRDTYPLPSDFVTGGTILVAGESTFLRPRTLQDLIAARRTNDGPAKPEYHATVTGQLRDGKLAVTLFPAPDQRYALDFGYRRRPRDLVVESQAAGTVTVTSGSAVVAGQGTAFSARHVGTIFRAGADAKPPTGAPGMLP